MTLTGHQTTITPKLPPHLTTAATTIISQRKGGKVRPKQNPQYTIRTVEMTMEINLFQTVTPNITKNDSPSQT